MKTKRATRTEIKDAAQQMILGRIAGAAENAREGFYTSDEDAEALAREIELQGARVAKLFNIYDFPGLPDTFGKI